VGVALTPGMAVCLAFSSLSDWGAAFRQHLHRWPLSSLLSPRASNPSGLPLTARCHGAIAGSRLGLLFLLFIE
jgi:hypothetical protein